MSIPIAGAGRAEGRGASDGEGRDACAAGYDEADRALGETVPKASVDISPKYAGRIAEVAVDLGDAVSRGCASPSGYEGCLDFYRREPRRQRAGGG